MYPPHTHAYKEHHQLLKRMLQTNKKTAKDLDRQDDMGVFALVNDNNTILNTLEAFENRNSFFGVKTRKYHPQRVSNYKNGEGEQPTIPKKTFIEEKKPWNAFDPIAPQKKSPSSIGKKLWYSFEKNIQE